MSDAEEREDLETKGDRNVILIVDNYPWGFPTDRITRLETIVGESIADVECKTVHYTQFSKERMEDVIGVILSGSNLNCSDFYHNDRLLKRYQPQLDLIQEADDLPILGVCFGFHLVAYAHDVQISRMRIPSLGGRIIFILLNETDDLITKKNLPVNAHHRDFISPNDVNIIENFDILSTYHTKRYQMVEYMKHKDKSVYATQFHPETHGPNYFHPSLFDERISANARMVGEEIIHNFIWLCVYKKKESEKILA